MVSKSIKPRAAEVLRETFRGHLSVIEMLDKMDVSEVAAGFQVVSDPEQNCIFLIMWNEAKTVGLMCRTSPKIMRDLAHEAVNADKLMKLARKAGMTALSVGAGESRWT